MADQVDKLLAEEVKYELRSNISFGELRTMLDKLMLHTRTSKPAHEMADSVVQKCLNVNQYLSLYGKQNPFNSVYRQRNKLLGSGAVFKEKGLYKYDLAGYYTAIE